MMPPCCCFCCCCCCSCCCCCCGFGCCCRLITLKTSLSMGVGESVISNCVTVPKETDDFLPNLAPLAPVPAATPVALPPLPRPPPPPPLLLPLPRPPVKLAPLDFLVRLPAFFSGLIPSLSPIMLLTPLLLTPISTTPLLLTSPPITPLSLTAIAQSNSRRSEDDSGCARMFADIWELISAGELSIMIPFVLFVALTSLLLRSRGSRGSGFFTVMIPSLLAKDDDEDDFLTHFLVALLLSLLLTLSLSLLLQ